MVSFQKIKALGSVKLENSGATARDHLANERTYLAWLRTSLTFASIGVAVAQFFKLQTTSTKAMKEDQPFSVRKLSTVLGGLFVASGLIVITCGVFRYFNTQRLLQHGKFPASRGLVMLCFLLTTVLIAITLGTLLAVAAN